MSEQTLYSFEEISRKMNIERLTVLYWLNRFKRWVSSNGEGRYAKYSDHAMELIDLISKLSRDGMSVEDIENYLETNLPPVTDKAQDPENMHGSNTLEKYFKAISCQQERLAASREDLVRAELKKAEAMNRRAEAEMIKAEAFLKIASAIEKGGLNALSGMTGEAKDGHFPETSPRETPAQDLPGEEIKPEKDEEMDDLSALIEDTPSELPAIDDLSALIDISPGDSEIKPGIDDLSILLEDRQPPPVDNLSALIDDQPEDISPGIDDLSALIEDGNTPPIDDLSSLISGETASKAVPESQGIDDLSALISKDKKEEPVDDLSKLIDRGEKTETDDLSQLIDSDEKEPQADMNEEKKAPEKESFEHYKSRILNIIIDLKKSGNDVAETTKILNDRGLKPLSGKGKWTEAVVAKIYSLIGTAAG